MQSSTITSRDGTRLNFVQWPTPQDAKAHVLLVGGLAEHMGRYQHVAKALGEAGYACSGVELRGHGHSGGKRGHVDSWSGYTDDVRAALAELDGEVFIVGHSMGGLVTTSLLLDNPAGVRGVVISNALYGVRFVPPKIKITAAKLLNKIMPRLKLSNELDTKWLCRDPEVVRVYEADPLVFSTITPRWYNECMAQQARAQAEAARLKLPALIMVGTGDQICSPDAARSFFDGYGGTDKEFATFEGLYHELFNEPEKADVLARVVAWLDAHA